MSEAPPPTGAERYHTVVDPNAENDSHALSIRMAGRGRRILELGCATGHVTEWLVRAENEVVGIEIDADAAERAELTGAEIHVLDLDRECVGDHVSGNFDVVLAADVLEHVRDPAATLRDAMSVLADTGEVIVSVPNAVHGDVRLHVLEGRVEYADDGLLDRTHLRWFTRDSLRSLLDDVGLLPVEVVRVKRPLFCADLGVDEALHADATIDFVRSDPEHETFQFVVRARRASDPDAVVDDGLEHVEIEWPHHSCDDVDELRRYAGDLRAALDAWEGSRTARAIAAVRRATSRLPGVGR